VIRGFGGCGVVEGKGGVLAYDGTTGLMVRLEGRVAMAMLPEQETKAREEVEKVVDSSPVSVSDPVAILAAGSVLYAWFTFYVRGNKESGIFIGLWAPTLLAAANYLQQRNIIRKFKRGLSSF
jgi:hypothetical protein